MLLVWERLVKSAFFELILAFTPGIYCGGFISQGCTGGPNHSVFPNNLVTLTNCESLKEIGKMACVTPAWSSRGQTYKSSFWRTISYFSFRALWFANDTAPPTFFMLFESNSLSKIQGSFNFIDINHGLYQPCYSLTIWPKIFRAFCFCTSCRSDRVLSMLLLL